MINKFISMSTFNKSGAGSSLLNSLIDNLPVELHLPGYQ